ncbi:MAG: LPS assembly protein LptD, partial [Magnetococcales bacterium]|nr:LPS assembly protein LptD [Magnetococcales bacterium]
LEGNNTQRLDLFPTLSWQRPVHFGRFTAKAGVRETAYLVHGDPAEASRIPNDYNHRDAAMGSLRLDARLERLFMGDEGDSYYSLRHTIEPTVKYIVNGATDQSRLPLFDSRIRDFSTTNLFAENQYVGADRINVGQSVAYGITTRLMGRRAKGEMQSEWANISLGQRWAPEGEREFQNNLPFSDLVSSLDLHLSPTWSATGALRYDPYKGVLRTSGTTVALKNSRKDTIKLGYHIQRPDSGEMTKDALLRSEINLVSHWKWTQRADYSLEYDNLKSWESGLLYEHDCWSLKLRGGRKLRADTNKHGGAWGGFLLTFRGIGEYGLDG